MEILLGTYLDKRTNEVVYVAENKNGKVVINSYEGEKTITLDRILNYEKISYSQARDIEKRTRKKADWLEGLLDSRFREDGTFSTEEIIRQSENKK